MELTNWSNKLAGGLLALVAGVSAHATCMKYPSRPEVNSGAIGDLTSGGNDADDVKGHHNIARPMPTNPGGDAHDCISDGEPPTRVPPQRVQPRPQPYSAPPPRPPVPAQPKEGSGFPPVCRNPSKANLPQCAR